MSKFYLQWCEKGSDDFSGEVHLPNVTEDEVRHVFNLAQDEYPGDSLVVTDDQIHWLKNKIKKAFDLGQHEYFVSIYSD